MNILKLLLFRWFNLSPSSCEACEILRERLQKSDAERENLLYRLLDKDKQIESPVEKEEFKPITPQHVPWRVRRELLEQEDRKKAQLMRERSEEINKLEKELGITDAS